MSIQQNSLTGREFHSNGLAVSMYEHDSLTRAGLSEAVVNQFGLSRFGSAQMLEMVLGEICDALARGESVKLPCFGTFEVRSKSERVGRNPKTGVDAKIGARKVLIFKASHFLRQKINGDRMPPCEKRDIAVAS